MLFAQMIIADDPARWRPRKKKEKNKIKTRTIEKDTISLMMKVLHLSTSSSSLFAKNKKSLKKTRDILLWELLVSRTFQENEKKNKWR